MRLAIFGSATDPQVALVTTLAIERGHHVMPVSMEGWFGALREPHSIRISTSASVTFDYGGEPLHQADAAWLRHVPPPFPNVGPGLELPALDREELHIEAMNARERSAAALAAIDWLRARGRPVINPPAAGLGIQNKPTQLMLLAQAGVPVPETLVSDEESEVRAFAQGRRVVFKPVTGGALAEELLPERFEELALIGSAPVIFQELIEGEDVRVTVVDDRIVSAVVVETAPGTLDFRSDARYARGEGTYRAIQLPSEVRAAVLVAQQALGLRFSGIDLRLDPARPERYRVLEANPSPTYYDIEKKTGHAISAALLGALERAP